MAKEVDLLSYWMPILRNIKEFKEIAKAEEPELIYILTEIDRAIANMYIETADEYGIKRFEDIMGIYPETGATLEDRRFAVMVKWSDQLPYTEETLKDLLTILCGEDGYTVLVDYDTYRITVKLALGNEDSVEAVRELLERIAPANMERIIALFNTHIILSGFTHEHLNAYTHKEVREVLL